MSLSVKEILKIAQRQMKESGIEDYERDSKGLYCYMTNITSGQMILEYQNILQDMLCEEYFSLVDRRSAGEPFQYITGTQEFMGIPFNVNPSVLIPRQDTETLVEDVMDIIKKGSIRDFELPKKAKRNKWRILDLGTGSGAIAVSLAKLCKNTEVTATDMSQEALETAEENSRKNGTEKLVDFRKGDLFEPFKGFMKGKKFDMIVSNPPYIKTETISTLQREVKDNEPMSALDGGSDGLSFYRRIIDEAPEFLKKNGILIMEIGHDQRDEIEELLEESGKFTNIKSYKDLAGRDRVSFAILKDLKKRGKH